MLTHVMLDLETWGTTPYSTIIAIGACAFSPYALEPVEVITDRFEVAIDPVSCQGLLRSDAKTMMWWMDDKRDVARNEWYGKPKLDLHVVLDSFTDWLQSLIADPDDLRVWGNGSDFDNVLLAQAYEVTKRDAPWSYWQNRCYRTLRNLVHSESVQSEATHTALADAQSQAVQANKIVRRLGIKLS